MEQVTVTGTVYFEEPFWIGVFARTQGGNTDACRVVFGPEPKDPEVYAYVLAHWDRLVFSPPVAAAAARAWAKNPKRRRRQARRALQTAGCGTKAQQALKAQQETGKLTRKAGKKQRLREEQDRKYHLRQQKRKEKHKGR